MVTTDIVVAAHLIGNPSPGGGVAVIFVEQRDVGEPAGSHAPLTAASEPLLLSADEPEEVQRRRFVGGLAALAEWARVL